MSEFLDYVINRRPLRECARETDLIQQQQQQLQGGPVKFMKLIDVANGQESAYEDLPADEQQQQQQAKRSGSGAGEQAEELASGGDSAAISVVGRSLPIPRADSGLPTLSRSHVSSILYGRRLSDSPAAGLINLGSYIKKAEPQKMKFMHFG